MNAAPIDPPYEVMPDRPFVYGIVDNATGMPVFLGVQNTMEGAVVTDHQEKAGN